MAEAAHRRMSEAEFLEWQRDQDRRYELVDGEPQAMTGAKLRHDWVTGNALTALRLALRAAGSPCNSFTADIAVRVPGGNLRRPDAAVHCPPFDLEAMVSDRPRLVVEVLSESTEDADQIAKLDEYKAIETLDTIILLVPHVVDVLVWHRRPDRSWIGTRHRTMADVIELPALGIVLPLAALYDGVELRQRRRPRLVWDDDTETA